MSRWIALAAAALTAAALVVILGLAIARIRIHLPARWVANRPERPNHRHRYRALQKIARENDPTGFRHALTDYLTAVYQAPAASALDRFRSYPGASEALSALDQAIYANDERAAMPDLNELVLLARAQRHGRLA